MVQPARARFQLDVAPKPVRNRADGYDHNKLARTIVEDVDRRHDGGAHQGWLVSDRLTQVDVVYLSSPDQARASHS